MKKNQKMMMSAATLAVLASSLAGACGSQSESLSQMATDTTDTTDTVATTAVDSTATDDTSTTLSSGLSSAGTAYADGTYTGDAAPTRWGDVQVSVTITDGSISNVQFLSYPVGDSRSAQINAQATGMLVQEAVQAQSSDVQVISGATFTSEAFMQSLGSALSQAG